MSVLMLASLLVCFQPSSDDLQKTADAIRTAFEANRGQLAFGEVRFDYSIGRASDPDVASRGALEHKRVGAGYYVFDGPNGRFELVFPPEVMAAGVVKSGNERSTQTHSARVLTDGKVTLWDMLDATGEGRTAEHTHTAQIDAGTDMFFKQIIIPLYIGDSTKTIGLTRAVETAAHNPKAGKLTSIDDRAKIDGFDVVKLTFESADYTEQYWVDIEHGAIPRMFRSVAKSSGAEFVEKFDQIQYVANRAWFPFRWSVVFPGGFAKQVSVREAHFDRHPDPSLFTLNFPKPLSIINSSISAKYTPRSTWNLSKLPAIGEPDVQRLPVSGFGPQPLGPPVSRSTHSVRSWFVSLNICGALLIMLSIAWHMFSKSRHKTHQL